MKHTVRLKVNGKDYTEEADSREMLVRFIRYKLRLTGTHVGCDTGNCGACTVLMNGQAVKSCLILAPQADGTEITTIEGLAKDGELHPVQQAFWDNHGLQCGFCTPGMVLSAVAFLQENHDPTEEEIRRALMGNLCRCTGYVNIVKAVKAAAKTMLKGPPS